VIGGIFLVCRHRHMWRLFIIQQDEERKNGEGSSQALRNESIAIGNTMENEVKKMT
jgi:hypothetical protein